MERENKPQNESNLILEPQRPPQPTITVGKVKAEKWKLSSNGENAKNRKVRITERKTQRGRKNTKEGENVINSTH